VLLSVMFIGSTQFPFLLEADRITGPAARSLVLGALTLIGAVTSFLYAALVRRLGVNGVIRLGFLCMALGLGLSGYVQHPAAAVLGAALMGIYVGTVAPYVYHVVTERTDARTRSHAIGVLNAFFFLGAFLNPLLFEPLVRQIGLRPFFLCAAAAMLGMTAISVVLQRARAPSH
jgi:MFS family permease